MRAEQEKLPKINLKIYLRLLGYARPYWKRLAVGIFAGILVGGSLLLSLLLIPQLVGVVDLSAGRKAETVSVEAKAAFQALSRPGMSREEQLKALEKALHPADRDPKLTSLLKQVRGAAEKFHLPLSIEGRTITLWWPKRWSFEAVSASGRVAWEIFLIYVVGFVLAWVVKNVATYVNHYCTRYVGGRVVADLREEIFRKLVGQSLRFYSNMDVGQLISRCTNDTSAIENAVSNSIADLTSCPIQIFACLAAILIACRQYNSYTLVLVLIVGVPLVVIPMHLLGRKIRRMYKETFSRIAVVFSRMHEVFSGIRVVKSYYTESMECERFKVVNDRYFRQAVRAMKYQLFMSPAMESVAVTSTLVFLVFSYGQGVSITELAALLAPAIMAYQPIKLLSKVITSIQKSMAAAERYFELVDTDTALPEKTDARELGSFEREIRLEHAGFAYDNSRKILDDVSLTIPRGHLVAVVGETGSGKTTIANLIARFYDVTEGRVTIDGIDVRDLSIASLRKLIGVVNQEAILFNDTIAANIAYGCPEAGRAEIVEAAKLANAHDFIIGGAHPGEYDAEVGENGFNLSGGEKQRIAIARAILRNPPILILDEATSALDTVTEKLVQEALNRVMSNRTVFAIAHRLSTIRNADTIIVLQHGRIAESGSHDELMALNGIYRRLYDTQFGE